MIKAALLVYATAKLAVADSSCSLIDSEKTDCGYAGIDQAGCESKGCCWSPAGENSATPWCFNKAVSSSYNLKNLVTTSTGFSGELLLSSGSSTYGSDLQDLSLEVIYETDDYVRVRITDFNRTRWEIPQSVLPRPSASSKAENPNYSFTYTSSPFSFQVSRKSDGATIFSSGTFAFKDQYVALSTNFDSSAKTFGIGESARLNQALSAGSTFTLWARDEPALVKNVNLYGAFPYYLQMINGKAHGAMLVNSNGMDITLGSSSLTFKSIGGMIDLYVFTGPTPAEVASQYTSVVGRPTMMPYWSFGFHNCRYGYKSVWEVEDIVQKYADANIPLDTQWMDIDYMDKYKDFTTDPTNFPMEEVKKFVDTLHQNGQKFVPMVDPGIMVDSGYDAYEQGLKDNIFVKDLYGSSNYLAQVWPGPVHFPDWLHPNIQSYWSNQLQSFHDQIPYDGVWIDMNEASNFCNSDGRGQVCVNSRSSGCPAPGASQTDCCLECSTPEGSNKYDFPPYNIHNVGGLISVKAIAASAQHYGGVREYDVHNLFGLTEAIATNQALRDVRGTRPFLLTRSSFLSSGAHTAKWSGDNQASWDDLKSSIITIMDFSLFGVPMIGADICGFIDDTTEELCARWIEVGAFYPFSRDHSAIDAAPQELYLWDNVATAARNALGMRYQLLPYMYSLFYDAHVSGSLVSRALWVNFPSDTTALSVDRQFMLGDYLLISPVVDKGATSVNAYFPQGAWYSFSERKLSVNTASGTHVTLSTPLTSVNVHVRGGGILPLQRSALTTTEGRKTPFTLVVASDTSGNSKGELFWDDGEQIDLNNLLLVSYTATVGSTSGKVNGTVKTSTYADAASLNVEAIVVMAVSQVAPTSATLNGVAIDASQITYNAGTITFALGSSLKITDNFELSW